MPLLSGAVPKVLPRDTLAYVRLANVPDTVDRFLATGTGRMFQDPQLRPLVSDTWATIKESLSQVQEQLGMTLDELISIPQGEIAFGVFRLDGQDRPGLALIVDCGNKLSEAKKLFARLKEMAETSGSRRIEEQTIAGTTVTVFSRGGGGCAEHVFEKDGTFVLCPDPESARAIITHWEGRQRDSFEDNAKFGE